MDTENQDKSILSQRESQQPVLSADSKSRDRLDELLGGCFALQKLYGRGVENAQVVIELFHKILANQPANKVIKAFEIWLQKSQEFPTPADIIGLVNRNGKPPIKESDIIAIRKKDGEHRTRAEWKLLREWDEQQCGGWDEADSDNRAVIAENERLRQELKKAQAEITRLNEIMRVEDLRKCYIPSAPVGRADRIQNTIEAMKAQGCADSDIEEFLASIQQVAA